MLAYLSQKSIISVIIPVYKVEPYIHECVDSVLKQTYKDLEVILVDDGSPDNCPEICDTYALQDNRIKVFHQKNGGLSAARNSGIRIASGDYLVFIDSDDYVANDFVEQMLHGIVETQADIVCCGMKVIGSNRTLISVPNETSPFFSDRIRLLVQENGTGDYYMNKLFKRSLFTGFELPVGKLYEDIYSMHYLFHKASAVVWINKSLYYYRINDSGISHNKEFNLKTIDFVYANKAQYSFITENYSAFSEMSIRKYASAIIHYADDLAKRANFLQYSEGMNVLMRLSKDIKEEVMKNPYCSGRIKHEFTILGKGPKKWKHYYRIRSYIESWHNHPRVQQKLTLLLKWDYIP